MAIKLFHGKGLNKGQNEGTDGHCVDFNISKVIKNFILPHIELNKASLALKIQNYTWFSAAKH